MGALLALAGATFYYKTFSHFSFYDDEGYVMLSVAHFLEGKVLFSEIYSQYGPSFYFYRWFLHNALRVPLTHDATRFSSLAVFLLSSAAISLATYRCTKQYWLSAIVVLPCYFCFSCFSNEPGHPQEYLSLLIVCLMLFASLLSGHRRRSLLLLIGVCLSLVLLTKINVGVFVTAAMGFSVVTLAPRSRFLYLCTWTAAIALLLLPIVLAFSFLSLPWVQFLVTLCIGSFLPILFFALQTRETSVFSTADVSFFLAVVCGSLAALICASLLCGTSLAALLEGLVLQHLGSKARFSYPLPAQTISYLPLILGLASFALYARFQSYRATKSIIAPLKLCYAIALIGFACYEAWPLLLSFGLPGLWLLLATTNNQPYPPQQQFTRLFIASLTILLSLQCFPVAGSQLPLSLFPILLAAAMLLADAVGGLSQRGMSALLPVICVASVLLIKPSYNSFESRYHSELWPLNLPGSVRLRIAPADREMIRQVANRLAELQGTFYTYPGMGSFYFWSEKKAPTARFATVPTILFDSKTQQRIVEELRGNNELRIVLRNQEIADFWTTFAERPENSVLLNWLEQNTVEWQSIAQYEVLKRKQPSTQVK